MGGCFCFHHARSALLRQSKNNLGSLSSLRLRVINIILPLTLMPMYDSPLQIHTICPFAIFAVCCNYAHRSTPMVVPIMHVKVTNAFPCPRFPAICNRLIRTNRSPCGLFVDQPS